MVDSERYTELEITVFPPAGGTGPVEHIVVRQPIDQDGNPIGPATEEHSYE